MTLHGFQGFHTAAANSTGDAEVPDFVIPVYLSALAMPPMANMNTVHATAGAAAAAPAHANDSAINNNNGHDAGAANAHNNGNNHNNDHDDAGAVHAAAAGGDHAAIAPIGDADAMAGLNALVVHPMVNEPHDDAPHDDAGHVIAANGAADADDDVLADDGDAAAEPADDGNASAAAAQAHWDEITDIAAAHDMQLVTRPTTRALENAPGIIYRYRNHWRFDRVEQFVSTTVNPTGENAGTEFEYQISTSTTTYYVTQMLEAHYSNDSAVTEHSWVALRN